VRAALAGSQIDHARRGVQEPRIAIPLVDCGGDSAIGSRKSLDRRHSLRARDGALCAVRTIAFDRRLTTDEAGEIVGVQRIVRAPTGRIPTKPFAPSGYKAKIARVTI
jgi:hypothetical protein